MGRRQSVAFCLVDVGFLSDPKFRKLARRLPDPDAFNSAVGAYFIALAASRRNGSSALDVLVETDTAYLDDLRAVGLLVDDGFPPEAWTEWHPMSPQQVAGRARAASAERNDAGHFTSALDSLDKLDQPSPPLPSIPIPSLEERGVRGGDDLWALYCGLTRSVRPSPNVMEWLNRLEDNYGANPVAASIQAAYTEDPNRKTLLGRAEKRLETKARTDERAAETSKRSDGIYDRMQARRLEWFRETGKWEPEWGDPPKMTH